MCAAQQPGAGSAGRAVQVRGLRKSYGDTEAVKGISFEVRHGEIFALLGPNGAGKTTTVEILEGYRSRSGGEVTVLGADPQRADSAWRGRLGIVLQACQVEPELTVRESLQLFAGYAESPRDVGEVIRLVGLQDAARRRAGKLSGGQQRRLDVGLGIIGNPEVLFLDEPTTGFDPAARHQFWDLIRQLRDLGTAILLTTHYMDEAQALADRVAILSSGVIVADSTPADLGGGLAASQITFSLPAGISPGDLPAPLNRARQARPGVVQLEAISPVKPLRALANWADERGLELADLQVTRPTLEDIYLKLTQEEPR